MNLTIVIYYFYNQNKLFQKNNPFLSEIQIISVHDWNSIYLSFKNLDINVILLLLSDFLSKYLKWMF